MKPNVLIVSGYGINCDYETEFAFSSCGANTNRIHINDLIEKKKHVAEYQVLVVPGGFAFGDDLGSGKILAVKLQAHLKEQLVQFVNEGKLVMGICNGFQVLVKLGILPGIENKFHQTTTLTFNTSGKFEDRWVYLKANEDSPCIFTQGIDKLYLPVRHGEGRFVTENQATLEKLVNNNQIVLQYVDEQNSLAGYPWNPNGSDKNIAAISDATGRIFGLMPHPEAFMATTNHPRWTRETESITTAKKLFSNAVEYAKRHL